LEVGQAVVKLQGRTPRPFLISIPEFHIQKGQVTDDHIKEHMRETSSLWEAQDPNSREAETREESDAKPAGNSLTNPEIRFLQDVQNVPDGGVAARYRRLGLSVRQGQKVKSALLENALIEEDLEITKFGRQTVIRLTEKGQLLLSRAKAPV
jgi:hypothetical protein